MPNDVNTTYSNYKVSGARGVRAGEKFPTSAEVNDAKDWDAYKAEKKLQFTAQRSQHEKPFQEWRANRTKSAPRLTDITMPK